jgi:hypothetical protein
LIVSERLPCDCISYNRPDLGGTVSPVVIDDGAPGMTRPFEVDACIVDALRELWDAGIETEGSCCGHNGQLVPYPTVGLCRADDVRTAARILAGDERWWIITITV